MQFPTCLNGAVSPQLLMQQQQRMQISNQQIPLANPVPNQQTHVPNHQMLMQNPHQLPNHQRLASHQQLAQMAQFQQVHQQIPIPQQHLLAQRPAPRIFKKEWSNDYKLFVGNLPPGVDQQNVLDLFGAYGELSEDSIVHTKKRLGFIKYRHKYQAERAILELANLNYAGHKLQVHYANHNAGLKISNLAEWVGEDHLVKAFRRFGELEKVHICYDSETKKSRGYGYIYFARHTDALACHKECSSNMLVLTISPRPVVVKMKVSDLQSLPHGHKDEDEDKHRREMFGEPHFPTANSLEFMYCKNWRDTMKRHEEELDELNKKQRKEIEKLALECRSYVKMVMKQEEKQREEAEQKIREHQAKAMPTQTHTQTPQAFMQGAMNSMSPQMQGMQAQMQGQIPPHLANLMNPSHAQLTVPTQPQGAMPNLYYQPGAAQAFLAQQRHLAQQQNQLNPNIVNNHAAYLPQTVPQPQTIPSSIIQSNLNNTPMEMSPSPPRPAMPVVQQPHGLPIQQQPQPQKAPLVQPPVITQPQPTPAIEIKENPPVPVKKAPETISPMKTIPENTETPVKVEAPPPKPEKPKPPKVKVRKGPPTPLALNPSESIISQLFGGTRPTSPTNSIENPDFLTEPESPESPLRVNPSPFHNLDSFAATISASLVHTNADINGNEDPLPKKRKFEEVDQPS